MYQNGVLAQAVLLLFLARQSGVRGFDTAFLSMVSFGGALSQRIFRVFRNSGLCSLNTFMHLIILCAYDGASTNSFLTWIS